MKRPKEAKSSISSLITKEDTNTLNQGKGLLDASPAFGSPSEDDNLVVDESQAKDIIDEIDNVLDTATPNIDYYYQAEQN